MEIDMLDKDAGKAADRFMEKLVNKKFTMSRSQNNNNNYDTTRQKRDSEAVAEFTKTQLFKDILKLS